MLLVGHILSAFLSGPLDGQYVCVNIRKLIHGHSVKGLTLSLLEELFVEAIPSGRQDVVIPSGRQDVVSPSGITSTKSASDSQTVKVIS